ncbi:MAG TPA: NADH:ubiquinone reductase (Na(+)-transporting) subunit F [Verrucomicrobiae bacterium]|jgi:MocE subfamily Rieske [2Fe-2S] domain protein|nr:NADH:ubiquinone reductase (Na(+)-transporting) subunit F [Verrucomicrobiae bacterium]
MPATEAIRLSDYSLVGKDSSLAIEKGLAEATWYASPVPREKMRELLQRRDWPAVRDTIIWFALIIGSGWAGYKLWQAGSWWAAVPFMIYGVLYASTSDSRWHEAGHGTAFKTDWLNNALYEIASFMVMRESAVWRWSHTRHHSDTIIVGRDPEIVAPRPPNIGSLLLNFFALPGIPKYFRNVFLHSMGQITPEEKTFIPESEYGKVILRARIYLLIYLTVIGLAIWQRSILPLMFIGLPTLYGSWLMPIYGYTQHAGLAENVLDHRLNCRTVYMNIVNRYLYWNMNYHVEHHMFPLVPYHNLPRLHEIVKPDMPAPYKNLWHAWREVVPSVLRQVKDPAYFVKRKLPTPTVPTEAPSTAHVFTAKGKAVGGWIEICAASFLKNEDVIRFDHEQKTYAVYRLADGSLHATDGICTHGNTHLADGLVKGRLIECPKHNGRFDIIDGSPQRQPVCVALKTYQAREHDGKIFLDLASAGGCGVAQKETVYKFRVVSNENVGMFIKELVLEAEPGSPLLQYQPGDYLQFDIPAYDEILFHDIAISPRFSEVWKTQRLFEFRSENAVPVRRNYSLATNPASDKQFRFNVRIATPPRGQDCPAGAGSAYIHRLKPGDTVTAVGPFGSFHVRPGDAEMVYVGGGAGMAPLRSHLSHLFETLKTSRRVSFWYGARSRQEAFYQDYFDNLARQFPNFTFHLALSEPLSSDQWTGPTGFVHDVLRENYLKSHADPAAVKFYLCGPPVMVRAATKMLDELSVPRCQIAFDEF